MIGREGGREGYGGRGGGQRERQRSRDGDGEGTPNELPVYDEWGNIGNSQDHSSRSHAKQTNIVCIP